MAGIRLLLICNIFALSVLVNQQPAFAAPQDFQTTLLMAAGQIKDTFDNGAAARDSKGFEIGGMQFKNDMEVGFGDAIKHKKASDNDDDDDDDRRRKRAADEINYTEILEEANASSGLSPASLEYYKKFTQDKQRKKRSADDSNSSLSSSSSSSSESSE